MRIETRLHDDEPAAVALRALSPRDRGTAIRLLIRRHHHELPGLIGLAPQSNTTVTPQPAPVPKSPTLAEPSTDEPAPVVEKKLLTPENLQKVINQAKSWQKAVIAVGFLLAGIGGFGASVPAHAADILLDVNTVSIHGEQWARHDLNQINPGLGITYRPEGSAGDWALSVGAYDNSYRRLTAYALAEWTPIHIGNPQGWHVDAGLSGGVASGYRRSEIPTSPAMGTALFRIESPSGMAASFFAVPNFGARASGFIGLQIGVPL
ncbi:hypothetical protein HDE76_004144 [Rhodanobacter sp. ANJX3]|uniref:hypothetical protein n=1 Tax=Rhodanobacter sp. ANJX3 TaxID=2723083 RepID=UPI001613AD56|nr:hypothetical protein [Rhodanobacter sp. ANJX3]MBB5360892.1 hypothetical protein [Rhodanobacter sp. ANJX3]